MSVPILTFFNNKGGVGNTSLVYHLAWMFYDLGYRVLACDLDPQANLTSMFLHEERLEVLWTEEGDRKTIYNALLPLLDGTGDIKHAHLENITHGVFRQELSLIVGDLMLSSAEDELSRQWQECLDRRTRAFRVISALWRILQNAANERDVDIILVDVEPNLGALNRAVLVATDYVIVPLGADLFSLQGLRNLGPTLQNWRDGWKDRRNRNPDPDLPMPEGKITPIGYVVQQYSVRLDRPVLAYDKWGNRMPAEYSRNLLSDKTGPYAKTPEEDKKNSLGTVKHYRSLVPMAQEARKPIFHLKPVDGAIGAHASAAESAYHDFKILAEKVVKRIDINTTISPE